MMTRAEHLLQKRRVEKITSRRFIKKTLNNFEAMILRLVFFFVVISSLFSCERKFFLFRTWKTANYKLLASDGKKVDGFLYTDFERLKTKYYVRTKFLS